MTVVNLPGLAYPCTVPYDAETRSKWLAPAVAVDEFTSRQAAVRRNMEVEGLDALLVVGTAADPASIAYLTNHFYSPTLSTSLFLLPLNGEPVLTFDAILHAEPMHSMIWNIWCDDVRPATRSSDSPPGTVVDVMVEAIRERGLSNARFGLVSPGTISGTHYDQLRAELPGIEWPDATATIARARMIKSPAEIDLMREACQRSAKGILEAVRTCQSGIREREVASAAHAAMFAAGVEGRAFDTAVSSGPRAGNKHAPPTDRVMEAGDLVFLDMGGTYGGYHADLSRCVAVEPAPQEKLDFLEASRELFEAALNAVKPGNSVQDIYRAAERTAQGTPFAENYMARGLGHGVGLALFELPSLAPNDDTILHPGMIFALEPMYVRYEFGTSVIEETVLVTEDGCETLSGMRW